MGLLILPASGFVYADTQIFIYSVERHPVYEPILRPLWQAAENGTIEVVTSELTLMEALVMPLRNRDPALQRDYEKILLHPSVRLLKVTQDVLRSAAQLRADIASLRTPDAIHAATAMANSCQLFLTNDAAFRAVSGLPHAILNDLPDEK